MTAAKIRVGGAWVDATKAGKVRIGGAWVDFGPAGASYEALAWPNPTPNLTNADDGSTRYNMGCRFTLVAGKLCYGGRWRAPTSAPIPDLPGSGTPHKMQLWDGSSSTLLASKDFTPNPGVDNDVLFDVPEGLTASPQEYVISVYTWHYVHRAATWPVSSPSGNVVADAGRFVADAGFSTFPAGNLNAWLYVSPLVGL